MPRHRAHGRCAIAEAPGPALNRSRNPSSIRLSTRPGHGDRRCDPARGRPGLRRYSPPSPSSPTPPRMDVALLFLRGFFGLGVLVGLAVAFSTDRRAIDWRLVGVGIGLQLRLRRARAAHRARGEAVFRRHRRRVRPRCSTFTVRRVGVHLRARWARRRAKRAQTFGSVFAFQVLPTIVFFASLMGVAVPPGRRAAAWCAGWGASWPGRCASPAPSRWPRPPTCSSGRRRRRSSMEPYVARA